MLLTLGVATTVVALVYLLTAILASTRRRWLLVPVVTYGLWFATFGIGGLATHGGVRLDGVGEYVAVGVGASLLAPFGLHALAVAVGALPAVPVVFALFIRHDSARRMQLSALVGIVAMFVLIGLVRADEFGAVQAVSGRYLYVAAPLVMIVGTLFAWRIVPRAAGVFLICIALVGQSLALQAARIDFLMEQAEESKLPPEERWP